MYELPFIILFLILLITTVYVVFVYKKLKAKHIKVLSESNDRYNKLLSQKKSSETVLGQIAEQLAPFLENFPFDPQMVKFLGQPIDCIYYGNDKIVFIEIKSGNSKLSTKQRRLKSLVEAGKVEWLEYRIPGKVKKDDDKKYSK